MSRFFQQVNTYFKLPEMRLFWYFLPLILIIFIIDILYLPLFWAFVSLGFFLVLTVIILVSSLRSARLNLDIKLERNQLKNIISNLSDGIIAYDQNFKVLIFNRAAEQIFDLKAEEVISRSFSPDKAKDPKFSLFCRVLFPSLAPSIIRHSESGVYPQIFDMSFEVPKMELRVTADRIIDQSNRLLGFVKIVHNRTRETEMLRSKDEFIEVAAHQLRTPLTSINWIFESLSKDQLADAQKEMVNMGSIAVGGLLKTVNDLLDVAQIEEGRFGYQYENVDIVDFIEENLTDAVAEAKGYGVKVYLKKPEDSLPPIIIDKKKLALALSNLLSNAIRYNVENGEVIIEVQRLTDKPFVKISIKDTGIGITPQDIKHLFSKFFRADNAQKAVVDGTGLGLYITKNIIKKHGGEIWAESQINRGTTFYFTLPTDPKMIPTLHLTNNQ